MILIDYNAIAMSNIFSLKMSHSFDENLIRHMILNTIRQYNTKFRREFGELVIASDAHSWRKDIFVHYKAHRTAHREETKDDFDWAGLFRILHRVRQELDANSPFRVINVHGAEGDDVIAVLTKHVVDHEKVLIISGDHDFEQLDKYDNVRRFSIRTKRYLPRSKYPDQVLFESICRGCKGDGVPNILSVDNSFVDSIRQKALSAKRLGELWDKANFTPEELKRFNQNQTLIDFDKIPTELENRILEQYRTVDTTNRMFDYLINNRCKQLIECIDDFKPNRQNDNSRTTKESIFD